MLANRRDKNEKELDAVFKAYGWQVIDSSRVGPSKAIAGFTDRIIAKPGVTLLVEYKSSPKDPLTDSERKFHDKFIGPIAIVYDEESAQQIAQQYGGSHA